MRQSTCFKMRNSLIVLFVLTLTFCSPRKESETKQDRQVAEVTVNNSSSERSQVKEPLSKNDSLSLSILLKYPDAVKSDTIRWLFTFAIQKLLDKSENILFFQDGRIRDIEEFKGEYLITIDGRDVKGKIIIKSDIWPEFVKYIGSPRTRPRGGFIIKVLSIIPVHFETVINIDDIPFPDGETLSEIDLSNYVHLSFETSTRPFYIITGELIDFYLL